jgi:glycosyltransferase involved in cell wall biosynthesis
MKILYHHRTLGDGAEGVHIHSMIDAFEALGHEVAVESLARPAGAGQGDAGMLATLRRRLPQGVFEAGALAANIVEFRAMRQGLRAMAPSFVYTRHALFDLGGVQAAVRARIPVVLEVNRLYTAKTMGQFEPLTFPRLAARLERKVLRLSDVVVAVSTPLRRQIEEAAGDDLNILVLPNGADPDLFDPARIDGREVRARYGVANCFIVGWVGVLRSWHGLDLLLRAAQRIPEAVVLIVGDGPARSEVEQLAESLGMSQRVHITGRLSHQEVPQHVAAFDIAVSPDDRTGFASPMKVIEYMAMARAVVVPRLPNFLDIVRDGDTGVVFEPSDSADLARRIAEVHASPELRQRLGERARLEVERRLNWQQNARVVLDAVASASRKIQRTQ